MNIFFFLIILILLVTIQFYSIKNLGKLGIPNIILYLLALPSLLITSSTVFYLTNILQPNLTKSILLTFIFSFFLQYVFINLSVSRLMQGNLKKINLNSHIMQVNKKDCIETLILLIIQFLIFIFYLIFNSPKDIIYSSGDGVRLVDLIQFIHLFDQNTFSLTYFNERNSSVETGYFYPWAGFTLSALFVQLDILSPFLALTFILIIFALFGYPIILFLFLKSLQVKYKFFVLYFAFSMTLFPFGLINSNNFAILYSIISCLVLIFFYIILRDFLSTKLKSYYFILSCFLLFSSHPSTILTFFILILSINIIFYDVNLFYFIKRYKYLIIAFLLTFSLILYLFILNSGLFRSYYNSINKLFSFSSFIQQKNIFLSILEFTYNYIINISLLHTWFISFPLLLISLFHGFKKRQDKLNFLVPFLIYLVLIFSSSISGIKELYLLSLPSLAYYESPLRISHLGILIYTLYVANFFGHENKTVS